MDSVTETVINIHGEDVNNFIVFMIWIAMFWLVISLLDYVNRCEDDTTPIAKKETHTYDPTEIFNKSSATTKFRDLFTVQDYEAIKELPDIVNAASKIDADKFFDDSSLKDPEINDFAIWMISNTNIRYPIYCADASLIDLFCQYWSEDKLLTKECFNNIDDYQLLKTAIMRGFPKLLKTTIEILHANRKPVCYYVNPQIYHLLTDDVYFNPKIASLYKKQLQDINVNLDMSKFSDYQLRMIDEYETVDYHEVDSDKSTTSDSSGLETDSSDSDN